MRRSPEEQHRCLIHVETAGKVGHQLGTLNWVVAYIHSSCISLFGDSADGKRFSRSTMGHPQTNERVMPSLQKLQRTSSKRSISLVDFGIIKRHKSATCMHKWYPSALADCDDTGRDEELLRRHMLRNLTRYISFLPSFSSKPGAGNS